MVKVGDLVRLKKDEEVRKYNPLIHDAVGLVMEWNDPATTNPVNFAGQEGDGWVLWAGRTDWDIMYGEDLEIVNEA